jgi:gamma-glutamyltranspeptidase/glutathione hydrolase
VIKDKSINGYLAVGVPGTVMGLETARTRYGTLPRSVLMKSAIALADQGFVLNRGDVDVLADATQEFRSEPNVAAVFLNHGEEFKPGERLVQKNLAATLRLIEKGGPDAFYRGLPASQVAQASKAHGGLLTREDFEHYTVTELKPITCSYRGFEVLSSPPPSSGGVTLCEMLKVIEHYPLGDMGFNSSEALHVITEAMRFAYKDRNTYLGDPDFIDNPVERLLSAEHINSIIARIQPGKATPSSGLNDAADEKPTTTHYSVVDRWGNAASVTFTINNDFGAKVIAGESGFFLNDEMDDFTSKPGAPNLFGLVQGKANAIAPGKRPLSSMTPCWWWARRVAHASSPPSCK